VTNIKFNIPFSSGNELNYLSDVIERKHFAGKGFYTQKCKQWMKDRFDFDNCFFTPSCTDALEMTALLLNLKSGDEVIVPSYSFVSTANAYASRGANIVYADSKENSPNVDPESIEACITDKTRAIVVVHYGGFPCDIETIQEIALKHDIVLIEDAACALGASVNGSPVGSFGHFATFSFHETKNITSGKGGMLVVNDVSSLPRTAVIWEKGTNRAAFFKGEVDKYGWVDFGSSFLNSEIQAAFLYGQLQAYDTVQNQRMEIWNKYYAKFFEIATLEGFQHNAHLFYLILESEQERDTFIEHMAEAGIQTVFHYQALHNSNFSIDQFGKFDCPNADKFERCLVRLPLYYSLTNSEVDEVINHTKAGLSDSNLSLVHEN
jgi:dTDP-4-amino-4,6-dideoxygalactose transaminase